MPVPVRGPQHLDKERQMTHHFPLRRPIVVGAAAAAVTGVLLLSSASGEGAWISQDALLAAIEKGAAPRVLDVRTTKEYRAGHVPGAVHIPYHVLWRNHVELAAGKGDPIVVTCSHGPRALMAKLQLRALGYEKVAYLQGQMSGWKRRGLPVTLPSL
jgi:rhodanese-related sulfurtransferase